MVNMFVIRMAQRSVKSTTEPFGIPTDQKSVTVTAKQFVTLMGLGLERLAM